MANTTVSSNKRRKSLASEDQNPIIKFLNWPEAAKVYGQADLMSGEDLSECQVAFLDPLDFATSHGLRNNLTDLSEAEYFPFDEREFGKYLVAVKQGTTGLVKILQNGGVVVVRSQIPNSHIKVHKRTTAGGGTYTQSLLSAFFWLEEIIGKYTFRSCLLKAVRYLVPHDPVS